VDPVRLATLQRVRLAQRLSQPDQEGGGGDPTKGAHSPRGRGAVRSISEGGRGGAGGKPLSFSMWVKNPADLDLNNYPATPAPRGAYPTPSQVTPPPPHLAHIRDCEEVGNRMPATGVESQYLDM
jgi:hypothetical protein